MAEMAVSSVPPYVPFVSLDVSGVSAGQAHICHACHICRKGGGRWCSLRISALGGGFREAPPGAPVLAESGLPD